MKLRIPLLLTIGFGAACAFKTVAMPFALAATAWSMVAMTRRLAPRRATAGTGIDALVSAVLVAALVFLCAEICGEIARGLFGKVPYVADAHRRLELALPDIGLAVWLALGLLPALRQLIIRRGLAPEPPPRQWQALGGLAATAPVKAALAQALPYLDPSGSVGPFDPRIGTLGLWPAAALFVASGALLWWRALRAAPGEAFACPGLYGRTMDGAIVAWGIVAGLRLIDLGALPNPLDNPGPAMGSLEFVGLAAVWILILVRERGRDPPSLSRVGLALAVLGIAFIFSVAVPAYVIDAGTGPMGGLGGLVAWLGTLPFLAGTLALIWYFLPRLLRFVAPGAVAPVVAAA